MESLISVIIPVYNVLPYLREALDSVINQTYRNLEIIIVDDGSVDGSGELCDNYKTDPRVKVIHQKNKGLSGARNTGLDLMTGEYTSFLDPDDAFHPDMIRSLMELNTRYKTDLAACSFVAVETEDRLTDAKPRNRTGFSKEQVCTSREAIIGQMEGHFDEAAWNKLYARKLWNEIRFPEGYDYEDMRIMPLLYELSERISITPRELVYHRIRKESITRTRTVKNMRDLLTAYRVLWDYADQTQPPFPNASTRTMKEIMLRTLVFRWGEMKKQGMPSESVETIRKEIMDFAGEEPESKKIQTKAAWLLFRYCPCMLLPARHCFRKLKRLCGKEGEVPA